MIRILHLYKILLNVFIWLSVIMSVSFTNRPYAQVKHSFITGTIKNFASQSVFLYQCYGDSLLLIDSAHTNKKGEFTFQLPAQQGMYRIVLRDNQWFYILNDGKPIQIKTIYQFSGFYNIATDSLVVLKSEENKKFYEFQHLQQRLNVAKTWLLKMIRLYPIHDPFHKEIEEEYHKRYKDMEEFIKTLNSKSELVNKSLSAKVSLAYYQPVNPDWKQPDTWRDSILAAHFFDYFNPADSFYLHSIILPEKLDEWISLSLSEVPTAPLSQQEKETKIKIAADIWLQKVKDNQSAFEWSLNDLLKNMEKGKYYDAMYFIYDKYIQSKLTDCEPPPAYRKWHEKMSVLKNIQVGSIAPDFIIMDRKMNLHSIPADYTLLLFWASWCPHCTAEIPQIKIVTDSLQKVLYKQGKTLTVVAISLDTDHSAWQKYVQDNNLLTWLNTSELKGWKGELPRLYNVYATPTMFLLDKEKRILSKPTTVEELRKVLKELKIK